MGEGARNTVIGAAVGGPVGAIVGHQIGQGRRAADEWRKAQQDPFRLRIAGIFDPVTEARRAGTLTYEQAQQALDRFNTEVSDFEQIQKEYEVSGGDKATVVAQSRETLDPLIAQWRTDLQAHVASFPQSLEQAPIQPEEAPTMATVLAAEGTTPLQKAKGAAEQQRKRSLYGGRASTILAGPQPLKQMGRTKTLLGF